MPDCNTATGSPLWAHDERTPNKRGAPSFRIQGASMMGRDALLRLLNQLLECERAGTKVAILCAGQAQDTVLDSVLFEVGRDEGRFCSMLMRHIERLGGDASRETGAFYQRLHAIPDQSERLLLLIRGQEWVVQTLDEALPSIDDKYLKADLSEMREAHARAIGRCRVLIMRLEPEKYGGRGRDVRRPRAILS